MQRSDYSVAEEGALRKGCVVSQNSQKMQNYLRGEENLSRNASAIDNGSKWCAGLYRAYQAHALGAYAFSWCSVHLH